MQKAILKLALFTLVLSGFISILDRSAEAQLGGTQLVTRQALTMRVHSDAITYNNISKILHKQGDRTEAIKFYTLGVQADPSYTEAKANIKTLNRSDDLQRLLAGRAWIKEKTEEYPSRIFIQLGKGSELSIKSMDFIIKDNRFFKFELRERKGKRFIVPINAIFKGYIVSEILYHLETEKDLLVIDGGQVIIWQEGSRKEIDLRGEYTPWFSTVSQQN